MSAVGDTGAAEPSARALLARHGLRPKRRMGQNFLVDRTVAARIAELATPTPGGTVVEIGAGLGALTRPLLERAARVVAVERDRDLRPILCETLGAAIDAGHLVVDGSDARELDLGAVLASGPRPRVLAGNLPYYITGPMLQRASRIAPDLDRVVFLVQREVADRLVAKPGTAEYGALTVFCRAAYAPRRAFVVRAGAFHPRPDVDSAVVVLDPLDEPAARETPELRELVRAAFGQRRKKLRNAWRGVLGRSREEVARAAEHAKVSLDVRGETLDIDDFARMEKELEVDRGP